MNKEPGRLQSTELERVETRRPHTHERCREEQVAVAQALSCI